MTEAEYMTHSEFITAVYELRKKGWTDTEILNFLLTIQGDKPKEEKADK